MQTASFRFRLTIATAFSAAVLSLFPATPGLARDGKLVSTYSDIDRCGTLDEAEDQFTLKCKGPGGASAILQYVEGRVGLLFLPSMQGQQLGESDLIPLRPSAGKVFPGKLEWRSLAGNRAPCAAVIRVPSASGKSLLVYDLVAGKLAGQASGNDGARRIADGICTGGRAAAEPVAASQPQEVAAAAPEDGRIRQAMIEAEGLFQQTYLETGISGVSEAVDSCYQAARDAADVARCARLDLIGKNNDEAFAGQFNMPKYKYFRNKNLERRFNAAVKRLKIEKAVAARIRNALSA